MAPSLLIKMNNNITKQLLEHIRQAPIVIVCGPICSGKTSLCKQIAAQTGFAHIPVSRIVASLAQTNDRSSLQKTTNLTETICETLDVQINDALTLYGGVLIDGIRQPDILEYLFTLYGLGRCTLVWIDPGYDERQTRWEIRAASKDTGANFDDLNAADDKMGLTAIKGWFQRITVL